MPRTRTRTGNRGDATATAEVADGRSLHGSRRTRLLVVGLLLFCSPLGVRSLDARTPLPAPTPAEDPRVIPFTLVDGMVCLPVRAAGDSQTLDIILDTGMGYKGLLLLKDELIAVLPGTTIYSSSIAGAGSGKATPVSFAVGVQVLAGDLTLENQMVAVTRTDLVPHDGADGVIGYSILGNWVVEIDYDRSVVVLHDPVAFEVGPGWESIPLTFDEHHWPFLEIVVSVDGEAPVTLDAYIDLGSPHAIELLVGPDTQRLIPARTEPFYAGRGLSGDIPARWGHFTSVRIGSYELVEVGVVVVAEADRSKTTGARAIVSGDLLRRFNIIFDYPHERLLVRTNADFDEPFR